MSRSRKDLRPTIRRTVGRTLRGALSRFGYDLVRRPAGRDTAVPPDCDAFTASLIERVAPYTLTTPERIIGLVDSVRYLVRAGIPGPFMECGVWRGGSVMVIAHTLIDLGVRDRDLYLCDTFTYVPEPGEHDRDHRGISAAVDYTRAVESKVFDHLPFDVLKSLLFDTGYPRERFHFITGRVEETLPDQAPDTLALCRLDTDWYESTAHEMEHLWPRLAPGGVLLVDDYGEFLGAKQAVDEYFARVGQAVMLHRLDVSGRLVVKPG